MAWEIEVSDEFKGWYDSLSDEECGSIHTWLKRLQWSALHWVGYKSIP
jgi:hypothetical protein